MVTILCNFLLTSNIFFVRSEREIAALSTASLILNGSTDISWDKIQRAATDALGRLQKLDVDRISMLVRAVGFALQTVGIEIAERTIKARVQLLSRVMARDVCLIGLHAIALLTNVFFQCLRSSEPIARSAGLLMDSVFTYSLLNPFLFLYFSAHF